MIDWVTENIAISEYPSSKTDFGQFHAVINLDQFTPYHIRGTHVHSPLIDGAGNEPEEIVELLGVMHRHVRQGKVLVHCAAGVSRSPFVIALYLSWQGGMPFEEALQVVASKRRRPLNVDAGLLQIKDEVLVLAALRP